MSSGKKYTVSNHWGKKLDKWIIFAEYQMYNDGVYNIQWFTKDKFQGTNLTSATENKMYIYIYMFQHWIK